MPFSTGEPRLMLDSSGVLSAAVGVHIVRRAAATDVEGEEEIGSDSIVEVRPGAACIGRAMHAAVSPDPDTRRRAARDVSGRTKDDGVMVEMNLVGADVGERSAAVTRQIEFLKADINATGVLRVHADGLIVTTLAAIARTISPSHTRPCAAAI